MMHQVLFDFIERYMKLTEEEKQTLLEFDTFKVYQKGDILLKEGQISNKGYFVLEGCLRKYYLVEGEERSTAFYTEMEGHTPQTMLDHKPSKYSIDCVEDSIISESVPEMEKEMFKKFPRFESLCRIISDELLIKKQISYDEFIIQSPEQRYLNIEKNRPELLQRIPQNQLASYIGITPQSLSRMRARLSKKR